eukprot:760632-Hanusia_phi.AAC.4
MRLKGETLWFDLDRNVVIFTTSKSRYLRRQTRKIEIDIANKTLRNRKRDRIVREFPFQQLLKLSRDARAVQVKIEFVARELLDKSGNIIAAGGQKDYNLSFASQEEMNLFYSILSHFVQRGGTRKGQLTIFTYLSRSPQGQRMDYKAVVDEASSSLYFLDDPLRKEVIPLLQVTSVERDATCPERIELKVAASPPLSIELLTEQMSTQFASLVSRHLRPAVKPTLNVSLVFTPPKVGKEQKQEPMMIARTRKKSSVINLFRSIRTNLPVSLGGISKHMHAELHPSLRDFTVAERSAMAIKCVCMFMMTLSERLEAAAANVSSYVIDVEQFAFDTGSSLRGKMLPDATGLLEAKNFLGVGLDMEAVISDSNTFFDAAAFSGSPFIAQIPSQTPPPFVLELSSGTGLTRGSTLRRVEVNRGEKTVDISCMGSIYTPSFERSYLHPPSRLPPSPPPPSRRPPSRLPPPLPLLRPRLSLAVSSLPISPSPLPLSSAFVSSSSSSSPLSPPVACTAISSSSLPPGYGTSPPSPSAVTSTRRTPSAPTGCCKASDLSLEILACTYLLLLLHALYRPSSTLLPFSSSISPPSRFAPPRPLLSQ